MRSIAMDKLDRLRECAVSDDAIVDYLIKNYLSGDDAHEFMVSCEEEFGLDEELE